MPPASPSSLRAETLTTGEQFRAAADLYTRVFGYDRAEYSLNPNLLSALARNGGSAVGVFTAQDELIGFAYGFAGRDRDGSEFHYSQAAVVDAAYQDAGVGRLTKEHQRAIALGWGHRTMRWTFDPMLARNAHFNFTSLGGEGVGFVADYYGRPGTDRVVVEWALERGHDPFADLRRAQPPALTRDDWGRVTRTAVPRPSGAILDAAWLAVPARTAGFADEEQIAHDPLRARVREALTAFAREGRVLVACTRLDTTTAAYLAVGRTEGEEAR
ncbi:GNAT family N-acetyltransferase [Microbacterium kyungheense]|uniref:Putative GNAT superfamily acetyltransferase n=1 Tax=Microbacterium kyungheense TaxID=1263636 RepID=A0A543EUC6_9MICO|nr:GNAT family N-acetyltransferase [Microbacterium kyungheense]TQM25170.1 putative GNAT superfamily acetyltransferase [Microbacterium kyungheense]